MSDGPSGYDVQTRDALLIELEDFHERILRAAREDDVEVVLELIQEREPLVERLSEALVALPLTREARQTLAKREKELQSELGARQDAIQLELGTARHRGRATLKYSKNR